MNRAPPPPKPRPVVCPICGVDLNVDPHRPPCQNVRASYAPPCLRSLGSVRKLTLAGTGHGPDFMAGRHRRRR